jgi:hypothetical protein
MLIQLSSNAILAGNQMLKVGHTESKWLHTIIVVDGSAKYREYSKPHSSLNLSNADLIRVKAFAKNYLPKTENLTIHGLTNTLQQHAKFV